MQLAWVALPIPDHPHPLARHARDSARPHPRAGPSCSTAWWQANAIHL